MGTKKVKKENKKVIPLNHSERENSWSTYFFLQISTWAPGHSEWVWTNMFEYYGGCEFMVCSVFTLLRGSNIPSVAAISHKPKAGASSPPELWKTTPSPFLSIVTENHSVLRQIFCFGFFCKTGSRPPPLLTECLLVVSKWITFMHQIPNGINHSIAFPPIHCVK